MLNVLTLGHHVNDWHRPVFVFSSSQLRTLTLELNIWKMLKRCSGNKTQQAYTVVNFALNVHVTVSCSITNKSSCDTMMNISFNISLAKIVFEHIYQTNILTFLLKIFVCFLTHCKVPLLFFCLAIGRKCAPAWSDSRVSRRLSPSQGSSP